MARPARSWVRKTYTVSPEVEKAIAMRAAEQGIDPGTVVDILYWNTFLKPDEARLKAGGFSDDELERIFAEEALDFFSEDATVANLADNLTLVIGDEAANLKAVKTLLKRWRKTRLIEAEYKEGVFCTFQDGGRVPSILECGCIGVNWLNPE